MLRPYIFTSQETPMPFTTAERAAMIERYAHGPTLLKRALAKVPPDALKWKPAPGKWSAHEIVVHCADSETNAHMRLRYLLAEPEPVIVGYDQDRWAMTFDYHAHPLELALATVEAVRANTLLTLGLFILVVNGISLALVAWMLPGFTIAGLVPAMLGSIVVGVTGWLASTFVGSSGRIEHIRRIEVTGRRLD